jgi:TolB-like protein/Flp pilus assembly protein TadD
MLTGKVPFEGETATDTLARILEREPEWDALPPETPTSIRTLLRRCLEKDPRRRLRDIGDAGIEIKELLTPPATATVTGPATPARTLRRWAMVIGLVVVVLAALLTVVGPKLLTTAAPGRIESLAVLPLQNLTGDPNQEYFTDGMTAELISALGKIGALQVRSRTSVMQYKDPSMPLSEIARKLKADAVVEGEVLHLGEKVRVTAKLIHASTDTHLWTRTYQQEVRDIFTLYGEIARTIAEEVEITLTPDQQERLAAKRPIDPEAYNLYLMGMFHLRKETPEGAMMGLEYLRQAIEHDPTHPLAYGALAFGYVISTHGPGAPLDAFDQARETALQALELDDNVAEAHAALAMTKAFRDWDWEGATEEYRRALELNPNLTMPRAQYAFYLLLFDRVDDALAQIRRVQQTDPLTPLWSAYLGWIHLWAQQYDEVIEATNRALELHEGFALALYVQGCAYAGKGMYDKAIELHQKAGKLSPEWKCGLAHTYALAGRSDEARKALAELETNHTHWDTWFIAIVYAALGDKDGTFKWLEIAYGPPNHPYLPWMRYSPDFRSLRDDPRFAELLRRMNLPH